MGYDIDDSGITKKTDILIVPYAGFKSGKVQKAQQQNTLIVPIQDFVSETLKYLGEHFEL